MSARRVTFEMNMTLAHLPVLSSDLCLTVERKMKKMKKKKNGKLDMTPGHLPALPADLSVTVG